MEATWKMKCKQMWSQLSQRDKSTKRLHFVRRETSPEAAEQLQPRAARLLSSAHGPHRPSLLHFQGDDKSKIHIPQQQTSPTETAVVRNLSLIPIMHFHVKPAYFLSRGQHASKRNSYTNITAWLTGFLAFLPLSCKEKFLFLSDLLVHFTFR